MIEHFTLRCISVIPLILLGYLEGKSQKSSIPYTYETFAGNVTFDKALYSTELLFVSCKVSGAMSISPAPVKNSGRDCQAKIQKSKIDELWVDNLDRVDLDKDTIRRIFIGAAAPGLVETDFGKSIDITESFVGECELANDIFFYVSFGQMTGLKKLTFSDVKITGEVWLNSNVDTLEFIRADFSKLGRQFELTEISGINTKTCYINLWQTDLSKINFQYQNLKLFFYNYSSFEDNVEVYQQLLNYFEKKGLFQSYEKLDKEFREYKYKDRGLIGSLLNWIDKHWWDYGYNKFLVVRNAICLNILFFVINIFFYKKLLSDGYSIEKFAQLNQSQEWDYRNNKLKLKIFKVPYIFLYTSYIFWGWKLDMSNVNIKRIGFFGYVLFQYLVGIVCLAYIANLIITR